MGRVGLTHGLTRGLTPAAGLTRRADTRRPHDEERTPFELDTADRTALAELLRDTIAADRFPLSPRIRRLRAILAKLDPPPAAAIVYPAPKPPGERRMAMRKGRRR